MRNVNKFLRFFDRIPFKNKAKFILNYGTIKSPMSGTESLLIQLGALSYLGIFVVSLLANMFLPVPEEAILLSLGYLAGIGKLNALILMPIVISGLLISDIGIYYLSKKGNKLVEGIYKKFFAKQVAKRIDWAKEHIDKVIFFSRFMIQLRFLGPFLAGHLKVKTKEFIKLDFVALFIYVPLYVFIGWFFQSKILDIVNNVKKAENIAVIIIGCIVGYSILKFIYKLLFTRSAEEGNNI